MTSKLTDERIEGELKLCPLCGLAAARKVDDDTIKCRFCGVIVSYRNAPENIWNGRPLEGKLLAEVKALKAEQESMAEEYSQRLSHAIDDYYNAWANHQVEMEQLKKQLTQAEAERDVLADACAGIVGSPDGQESPSLVHKGIITKWLKYAQQQATKGGGEA